MLKHAALFNVFKMFVKAGHMTRRFFYDMDPDPGLKLDPEQGGVGHVLFLRFIWNDKL